MIICYIISNNVLQIDIVFHRDEGDFGQMTFTLHAYGDTFSSKLNGRIVMSTRGMVLN